MTDDKAISRRNFIQRISFLGVAGMGAGALLSACGGGETETPAPAAETPAPAAPQADAGGFSCMDTAGLTDAEKNMRTTLQYVDASPDPAKLCEGCALWQGVEEGNQCGGCTVVKGPIHPKGYCTSWAAKPETAM